MKLRIIGMIAIVLVYFAWPNARPDFTEFNAHDSESYLALSYSLVHGLGYTRNMVKGSYIPHTTWPPGLPVILMPALMISGDKINWLVVKATIIMIGLVGIALLWFYTQRLSQSNIVADVATLFLAFNPFYWHFSRIAMTEMPVIVWLLGSLLLIDRVWAKRRVRAIEAGSVGVLVGIGMLLKGIVFGLGLVPLAYLFGARRSLLTKRSQLQIWTVYAVAFALPFLIWNLRSHTIDTGGLGFDGINQLRMILATEPNDPDSLLRDLPTIMSGVINVIRYHLIYHIPNQIIPGLWAIDLVELSWPIGPCTALILSLLVLLVCIPRRVETLPIFLSVLPIALLTLILVEGLATRFWAPVLLLLAVMLVLQLSGLLHRLTRTRAKMGLFYITLCGLLTMNLAGYIQAFEREPYNTHDAWHELALLFKQVASVPMEPPVAVATPNPHAFTLMTGYASPMARSDLGIDPFYSHVVLRADQHRMPPGAHIIIQVPPWLLVALPEPLSNATIEASIWKTSYNSR